jgi:wyosine [tRNA(Phe)-imidazoG37] synthetase (radical SAM superfamily)
MTFLFDKIIFGPVQSRRLGTSLGINLLPEDSKYCNFDCIYCECGWTPEKWDGKVSFHSKDEVYSALDEKLSEMHQSNQNLDVITFAGNGEPTLHPDFAEIIDFTIELRNKYFPKAEIAVLSNATRLHKAAVFEALMKIDQNIQKIDSPFGQTIQRINQPKGHYELAEVVEHLKRFKGKVIIQSMFIEGAFKGESIDNTSDEQILAWQKLVEEIKPQMVMIYTIARDTPAEMLQKVSIEKLNAIAHKIEILGIKTQVSG